MQKRCIAIVALLTIFISVRGQKTELIFHASDSNLENAFNWARDQALHYRGKPGDSVGAWYESALPPRDAFCIRDACHQSIGAEILGLSAENKNMFTLFTKNISENKDWCSYWEINKYGKPAPEDYRSDKEFWYNLNANFDLIKACWELYLWTGDSVYINGSDFRFFFERTISDYIIKWSLQQDSLLDRRPYPNTPVPFNIEDPFQRCRGLPSYSEGVHNLKMGVDLVAAMYNAFLSYASMQHFKGDTMEAEKTIAVANTYRENIDKYWWDKNDSLYNTYFSNDGIFGKDEGETFLIWFDALKDSARKEKTIAHLNSNKWNVENLSYFPLIMYRNHYYDEAYKYILHLSDPLTHRREYPEVSFGVIGGIVQGLMGIEGDARSNSVSTLYKGKSNSSCNIENVPVLGTRISVKHKGDNISELHNYGKKEITWKAGFTGLHAVILFNGKKIKTQRKKDWKGGWTSFAEIIISPGQKITAIAAH